MGLTSARQTSARQRALNFVCCSAATLYERAGAFGSEETPSRHCELTHELVQSVPAGGDAFRACCDLSRSRTAVLPILILNPTSPSKGRQVHIGYPGCVGAALAPGMADVGERDYRGTSNASSRPLSKRSAAARNWSSELSSRSRSCSDPKADVVRIVVGNGQCMQAVDWAVGLVHAQLPEPHCSFRLVSKSKLCSAGLCCT